MPAQLTRGILSRLSLAAPLCGVKSGSPYFVPFHGHTSTLPVPRSSVVWFRQDVRCGSFERPACLVRVPAGCKSYPLRGPHPNRRCRLAAARLEGMTFARSPGRRLAGSTGRPTMSSVSLPIIYVTPASRSPPNRSLARWWSWTLVAQSATGQVPRGARKSYVECVDRVKSSRARPPRRCACPCGAPAGRRRAHDPRR